MWFGLCLKWREPMGVGESTLRQAGIRHGAMVSVSGAGWLGPAITATQATAQQTGFLGRALMLSKDPSGYSRKYELRLLHAETSSGKALSEGLPSPGWLA